MAKNHLLIFTFFVLLPSLPASADPPTRRVKVFILAGQSNMVGWGDSRKLPEDLEQGSDKVLMFENGKWQPLKPIRKAQRNQQKFGMTEFSFGPEIFFGHEMSTAWPNQTIGIVKFAVGGTSILTWKPNWSKEDADRVGQGRLGSLFNKLMEKVDQAARAREVEFAGFLWLQGGGDMKNVTVAQEYLNNLQALVAAVRKHTGVPNLPFLYGSQRRTEDPDDISDIEPQKISGHYPAAEFVLRAQWDAQSVIPDSRMVILRDIETHPMNVHYNTSGQRQVGKLFAQAFLSETPRVGGYTPDQILDMLAPNRRDQVDEKQLAMYHRIFGWIDTDDDGQHTKKEFIDDGRYLTLQGRRGIFQASDSNSDGIVSEDEYIKNRVITDEAKSIFQEIDSDNDGKLTRKELLASEKLKDEDLVKAVFDALDSDSNGEVVIPEYLRVWGRWARSDS
jgi:Ca2+-binding EF-hand superfamily protein